MTITDILKRIHYRLVAKDTGLSYSPYLYLVYLLFLLQGLFASNWDTHTVLATALSVVVFLPLYFRCFRYVNSQKIIVYDLGILLLGVLLLPFNYGASTYFIYASAMIAFVKNTRLACALMVTYATILSLESWLLGFPIAAIMIPAGMLLIIGFGNLVYASNIAKNQQLKLSQKEVSRLATIAERERISRDLHDLLGHTLSVITLKAELAGKLLARQDHAAAAKEVDDLQLISRDALNEVRNAVSGYRQTTIGNELQQASTALEAARIEFVTDIELPELSDVQNYTLAMCLREATTNIIRHSSAKSCNISLHTKGGFAVLSISDSGPENHAQPQTLTFGSGLNGMQDRVATLNGTLELSQQGGVRLDIALPLEYDVRNQQPPAEQPASNQIKTA